ncbi:hypothetical protein [Mitsuaria sp. 7]|uniref:immunoglobulin domain-containing protein n=1 Tax=Mitsuaria sp. 7 TaxID=1658665 RepID=UPI00082A8703|nr:hypothetical protein [Mitsuaria sp. 7]
MISAERKKAAIVAALSLVVAACGGGGGGDSGSNTPAKPAIATQPDSIAVLTDGTATLTVAATGTGLSYQWQKNGADIVGATSASYQTPAITFVDQDNLYTVVVTNAGGKVTSVPVMVTLKPSPNQKAFEDLYKGSSSYKLTWNLSPTPPQVSGTNYLFYDDEGLHVSPLTKGPQILSQSPKSSLGGGSLIGPDPKGRAVLKNGGIHFLGTEILSYVGGDLRVDTRSRNNPGVIVATEIRSNYEAATLTGGLAATPDDFAHFHYPLFAGTVILDTSRTYVAGAAYIKYTRTNKGDRYNVFDCFASVSADTMLPCGSGSLGDLLTAGISSGSDGTTYFLADGVLGTVDGRPVWVANKPRPVSATLNSAVQYRIYFELNGNVYTGALVKDGEALVGSSYVSNPNGATPADRITLLPFDIRMNKAALDSIATAKKF